MENGGSSGPFSFYINTFANVVRESTSHRVGLLCLGGATLWSGEKSVVRFSVLELRISFAYEIL